MGLLYYKIELHYSMKLSWEHPVIVLVYAVLFFSAVELYHIYRHDTFCKTEAEWIKTLPPKVRNQLR